MKISAIFLRLTAVMLLLSLLFAGCAQPAPSATDPTATEDSLVTTLPDTPAPDNGVVSTEPTQETTGEQVSDTTAPTTRPSELDVSDTEPVETEAPEETAPTTEVPTVPPTEPATEPPTEAPTQAAASGFKVYFLDVGQADAALVICDGKTMLIDGGNSADSNLIYSVLKRRGVTHLDYIIASHAHEDHVGGLSGALQYATVDTVYCPVTSYNSNAFRNFSNAVQKQGKQITVPASGTTFYLGSAKCSILAVNTGYDANNTSIVLRIVYGSTSFLFTGDAEREVEQILLNRGVTLKSTVLKVGHHGSYTSSSYAFLRSVMPQYAVISCGKGNSYGHPHDEVLSRLHDADIFTFRTDLQGDIVCTSNGRTVKFSVDRNWDAPVFGSLGGNNSPQTTEPEATLPPTEPEVTTQPVTDAPTTESTTEGGASTIYILDTKEKIFHSSDCELAARIAFFNRLEHRGSRAELLDEYTPCDNCNP